MPCSAMPQKAQAGTPVGHGPQISFRKAGTPFSSMYLLLTTYFPFSNGYIPHIYTTHHAYYKKTHICEKLHEREERERKNANYKPAIQRLSAALPTHPLYAISLLCLYLPSPFPLPPYLCQKVCGWEGQSWWSDSDWVLYLYSSLPVPHTYRQLLRKEKNRTHRSCLTCPLHTLLWRNLGGGCLYLY